ncbi:MAG: hypothetical protein HOE44_17415 [Candidatus Marinimicrobia bacterium]|jgi:hypothetical protein|nr:hypothetical protein [Candidatus Neomarinimicrobiota bacterium]
MRNTLFTALFLSLLSPIFTQQKATTETGEIVILMPDKTWEFESSPGSKNIIKTNPEVFEKNKSSSFLVRSKNLNIGFYINPKTWTFNKAELNEDAEYELEYRYNDLYGLVITEKVEIPIDNLANIAFETAKDVAPDMRIVNQEYRLVNGLKVLHQEMVGTLEGINLSYYAYYYSNANGSAQFLVYSGRNIVNTNTEIIDELLNGLVVLP